MYICRLYMLSPATAIKLIESTLHTLTPPRGDAVFGSLFTYDFWFGKRY